MSNKSMELAGHMSGGRRDILMGEVCGRLRWPAAHCLVVRWRPLNLRIRLN